jgi:surface antigen
MSGALEQFPVSSLTDGLGTATETFSNIKTSAAVRRAKTAPVQIGHQVTTTSVKAASVARNVYRPRFVTHAGLLIIAGIVVISNSPVRTHALSLRLTSAQAGIGSSLDEVGQAAVAADIASSGKMMITEQAAKTATAKTSQVSLLTTDDLTLAKRQVVQTAGNATRDITSYTVSNGDTLTEIAAKFDITSATLVAANDLASADAIKPGEALTILPVSGLLYTVGAGDTPDSLAAKYSANSAQITSYNNAEVKGLVPGAKIIIPDGVMPQAPAPVAVAAVAAAPASNVFHTSSVIPKLTSYAGSANGYSFGYCTWYVANRRAVPSNWGNANQWYYNAQASGFSVGASPVVGAIAWTGAGYYGHVAYVEAVSGNTITVSEMNFNGNWDRVTSRTASASSFRYIY